MNPAPHTVRLPVVPQRQHLFRLRHRLLLPTFFRPRHQRHGAVGRYLAIHAQTATRAPARAARISQPRAVSTASRRLARQ
jgi:hypothetical protein